MLTVSQAAINQAVNDIRTGAADDFVADFFASRPDWQEKEEKEEKQEDKEGTAQA